MKREHILAAMQFLDDAIVEETAAVRGRRRKHTLRTVLALVACVAVLVCGLWIYDAARLPKFSIAWNNESGGAGGNTVLCYDIASYDETNPWDSKTPVRRLPVYKNTVSEDENFIPIGGLTEEQMAKHALEVAEILGFTVKETKIDNYLSRDLTAVANEADIRIDPFGTVGIFFGGWSSLDNEGHLPLPEAYNFRSNAGFAEAEAALYYLMEQYASLLGFEQPTPILTAGFTYKGERRYHYVVYEGGDNAKERILNYACRYAVFYPDENGRLSCIRLYNRLATAEYLGDYPVVSGEEAYELLLDGQYVGGNGVPFDTNASICKQALIYRAYETDATFLPYYVFYVEDPTTYYGVAEGLVSYLAYYVPAIQPRYIENMPLWDGTTYK